MGMKGETPDTAKDAPTGHRASSRPCQHKLLVENLFSKMAHSMLREIRVDSKQELTDRIHQYFQEVNADPVVFRWKYKMDETVIV